MKPSHELDEILHDFKEHYDRLHDHCQALSRKRDGLEIRIMTLLSKIEQLTDELYLAHEALRRQMP